MKGSLRLLCVAVPSLVLIASEAHAQCEALKFDGSDDIASVIDSANDFDMGSAMTVEAWYQVDVTQTGAGLIGGTSVGGGGAFMFGGGIGTPSDGLLAVSVPNTDAVITPNAMLPGGWNHMAATYDGANMVLYLNGAQVATHVHTTSGSVIDVESLVFGRFAVASSSLFFQGSMDELRLWNVVRTPAEIMSNYNVGLAGNEPGLVGYYQFDEGNGDVILDSSVNGNDGFLGGSPGAGADDPTRVASGVPFSTCAPPGTAYCFGDGTGASCPCSAFGIAGAGCANTAGSGATMTATGSASFGSDSFRLAIVGVPGDKPGLILKGDNQVTVPAGDGILCTSGASQRSHVQITSAGATTFTDFNGSPFGSVANAGGVATNFQFWYRDPQNVCSGGGFNFSNGWTVTYMP